MRHDLRRRSGIDQNRSLDERSKIINNLGCLNFEEPKSSRPWGLHFECPFSAT